MPKIGSGGYGMMIVIIVSMILGIIGLCLWGYVIGRETEIRKPQIVEVEKEKIKIATTTEYKDRVATTTDLACQGELEYCWFIQGQEEDPHPACEEIGPYQKQIDGLEFQIEQNKIDAAGKLEECLNKLLNQ